jgi:hypothetical protein
MRRTLLFLTALVLALAIPAIGVAQGPSSPAASQTWEQKSCANPWRPADTADQQTHMRWQAYHNLDCAMAMIDEHLGAGSSGAASASEDDTVAFSREDLGELRRLILVGKDAALRIER